MSTLYERIGGHEGILRLIKPFYADVRQHARLGSIFNAQIHDWPAHMEKITEFWARQMGGPSRYQGGFAAAHFRVNQKLAEAYPTGTTPPTAGATSGLRDEHFAQWLNLWDFNCQRQLPPTEAAEASQLAHRVGGQLRRIITGHPGLQIQ